MYHWSGVEQWSFLLFVFLLCYAVPLYLISALLFPGELSPGFDFKEHFFRTRPWVFGFLTLAFFLDVFETTSKALLGLRPIPPLWYPVIIFELTGVPLAAYTRNEPYHKIFAPVWLLVVLLYILFARRVQAEVAG